MLCAVAGVSVWRALGGVAKRDLLIEVPGLVVTTSIAEADELIGRPIARPRESLGSTIELVGLYTQEQEAIPKETITLVYARNHQRFVEFTQRPAKEHDLEALKATKRTQPINLGETEALMVSLVWRTPTCQPPNARYIGMCQITKKLVFVKDDTLYSIAADGHNASEGELITLARSLIDVLEKN